MNYEEAAKKDLEAREFHTLHKEDIKEEKLISLGKATGYEISDNDEPSIIPGYVEIWPEKFPSKGLFYSANTRFFIRAAEVKEIRHFSTINEQDPFSVDEALNEIIKSCLMIRQPGRQMSFKDLKEEDRIYIILAIRELTFSKGENQLIIKSICKAQNCGHKNDVKIENDSFVRNEIDSKLMKYYNEETRQFEVQTKSNGIIEIVPPSIGVMMEITKYLQKLRQEEAKIDQSFIKVLPYMIKDWRGFNEKMISNLEVEFLSWNSSRYSTMFALTEMCKISVKENLVTQCEKCQSEVTTPISFPGGIKSLFVISDISGELL